MPKYIDKKLKREKLAHKSIDLFLDKGFKKPTISDIAKYIQIGKGSFYTYFTNKDDIIFAIIEYEQKIYDSEVTQNIKKATSTKEKVFYLFSLCIDNDINTIRRRKVYKEFISICLTNPSDKMIEFQENIKNKYTKWLKNILANGIKINQVKPEILEFTDGLFTLAEGSLMFPHLNNYNGEYVLESSINSLFKLMTTGEK